VDRLHCIPYFGWSALISAINFLCQPTQFPQYGSMMFHHCFKTMQNYLLPWMLSLNTPSCFKTVLRQFWCLGFGLGLEACCLGFGICFEAYCFDPGLHLELFCLGLCFQADCFVLEPNYFGLGPKWSLS